MPKNRKGFTLIELLVVVGVIAILAAIAMPQYSAYRKKGFAAEINSDARNAFTVAGAMLANGATPAQIATGGTASLFAAGYTASPNATLAIQANGASDFIITVTGLPGWGLASNAAQINSAGTMTPAIP